MVYHTIQHHRLFEIYFDEVIMKQALFQASEMQSANKEILARMGNRTGSTCSDIVKANT